MKIEICIKGGGLVLENGENPILEAVAVPRVGDRVTTDALSTLQERLDMGDPDWIVEEVNWHFGRTREELGCDATVWVDCPWFRDSLERWIKSRQRH